MTVCFEIFMTNDSFIHFPVISIFC